MSRKLEQQMQELKVEPIFYYEGRVTVCLLRQPDGLVVARGVAICSPTDQFVKKTGRNKALGQAMLAFVHRKDAGEIRAIKSCRFNSSHPVWEAEKFLWRSRFLPKLTDNERGRIKIIDEKRRKEVIKFERDKSSRT